MIELKELHKAYHAEQTVSVTALKNVNLKIPSGEIFGILGKSGAGKSTLLRCVNLLERPTSGKVYINNTDLLSLPEDKLRAQRRRISIIFQHFNLLDSRNVIDNIALPLEFASKPKEYIDKKAAELLALVGLADKRNYFPAQLSGGQKQRVAIARALATEPEVLLSDEATSSLDTETTKSILHLLKKINRELGLTIVLITHELEVIKQICDRVGVLHKGELIEQGSVIEVLINPQTSLTQRLVKKALHLPEIKKSAAHLPHTLLLQLTFIGEDSDKPLISTAIKNFDITINIKQAQIENIQDTIVGFTVCEIAGEENEVQKALAYIRSTSIKVEVL
jgi:D-methionine transport system ATP-binding protein